ncbi:MAG TPA: hypothetical protein VIU81_06740 [Gaiellaceae bacterium]
MLIDAVESELGIGAQVPAARREYGGLRPAKFIPPGPEEPADS